MSGFNEHIPYYYQLMEILLNQLRSGQFRVGDQFPTEMELVAKYGVSRPTVRRAIAELVQEGYLERSRGRGTFVARPAVVTDARVVTTFAAEMQHSGRQHRVKLLQAAQVPAVGALARDLAVAEGDLVFEITRLRLGDEEPLVLEISQVPVAVCPNLLAEANLEKEGLYDALERLRGIRIGRAQQVFQAIPASDEVAKLLGVRRGAPILLWQGVAYNLSDRPVERLRVYYRGDRYRFSVQQQRVDSAAGWQEVPIGKPGDAIGVMAALTRPEQGD